MKSEKFLEFNGKAIYFLAKDGQYWIAIKPICEALGVDYERQRRTINNDNILGQLPSNQTVVARDGRLRKMVCLPEKFIYGWIFSLHSKSPKLLKYKKECYEVLYDHFHGTITGRSQHLKNKTAAINTKAELIESLKDNPEYIDLQLQEQKIKEANAGLKTLDNDLVKDQLPLWETETDSL